MRKKETFFVRKRLFSLVIITGILFTLFSAFPNFALADTGIGVGDYLRMGTYYGQRSFGAVLI